MSMIPSSFGRRSNVFDPFSFDIWDPSENFHHPSRQTSSQTMSLSHTRIDWRETPTTHVFKADLPGLKKEEVKVEVGDGNVLQISGERMGEQEERSDTWHRIERSSGQFSRKFRLPENAIVEEIKASLEDGVLTITLPKEEARRTPVRSIQISGQ